MEENQTPKQDMVDRKVAGIEKLFTMLFTAINKNLLGTILILSLFLNIYQYVLKNNLDALRLADLQKSKEEMIKEVRQSVQRELPKQMAPIQAKQDSVSKNVDTSLLNLNGTLETVKKLIKSKK